MFSGLVVQVFDGSTNVSSGKAEYSLTFPDSKSPKQIADELFAREKGQRYLGLMFSSSSAAHEAILASVCQLISSETNMRGGVGITADRILKAHLV